MSAMIDSINNGSVSHPALEKMLGFFACPVDTRILEPEIFQRPILANMTLKCGHRDYFEAKKRANKETFLPEQDVSCAIISSNVTDHPILLHQIIRRQI